MSGIIFFDTEVTLDQEKIIDFGAINDKGEKLQTGRIDFFSTFIKETSFCVGIILLNTI